MASYREQGLKAKAVREGIIEARPVGTKNARARPVVVEYQLEPSRSQWRGPKVWEKWGAYRSPSEASAVVEQMSRKYVWYEYRIRPASPSPIAPTPTKEIP